MESRFTKIYFYIKNPKAKNTTSVFVNIQYKGERLQMPTGISIAPKDWNIRTRKPKQQLALYGTFQDRAGLIEMEAEKFIRESIEIKNLIPVPASLKAHLQEKLLPQREKQKAMGFFDYWDQFTEERETGKDKTKGGKVVGEGIIKRYKVIKKHLQDFQQYSGKTITFEAIDIQWHENLMDFLFNQKEQSRNTAGKATSVFKTFMNWGLKKNIHQNTQYKYFTVYSEESDQVYLNMTEITTLFQLDLSDNKRLERVRDLFIVGAMTALRISDFKRLDSEHLQDGFIRIRTQKTGQKVVIPLHPYVKQVTQRYSGNFPEAISDQKFNEYLKELGELAGIDQTVKRTENKAGQDKEVSYKKFELLSSHVCRRSGATNLYLAGIPSIDIMKITGHKTEKAFMKYIRVTAEENANRLKDHAFFSEKLTVSHKAS